MARHAATLRADVGDLRRRRRLRARRDRRRAHGHPPGRARAFPRGRGDDRGHPGRRSRLRSGDDRRPRGLREGPRLHAQRRRRARGRASPRTAREAVRRARLHGLERIPAGGCALRERTALSGRVPRRGAPADRARRRRHRHRHAQHRCRRRRGFAHAPDHAAGRPLAARRARQPRAVAAARGAARDRRTAARRRFGRARAPTGAAAPPEPPSN